MEARTSVQLYCAFQNQVKYFPIKLKTFLHLFYALVVLIRQLLHNSIKFA